jgi:hypothetical protein
MAHFAELDENNIVQRVIVVGNDVLKDATGQENEELGKAFCQSLLGGNWVQTSYNGKFRKMYAGIGYRYVPNEDVFLPGDFSSIAAYDAYIEEMSKNSPTLLPNTPST